MVVCRQASLWTWAGEGLRHGRWNRSCERCRLRRLGCSIVSVLVCYGAHFAGVSSPYVRVGTSLGQT